MSEQNIQTVDEKQAKGCFQLLDLMIFIFGSFMMFGKTASLLTQFADTTWFGFSEMEVYYGIGSALLIEGFLVAMKIKSWILPPKNLMQWASDLVVTYVPFGLSAFAQVADSWIETGYIQQLDQGTVTAITIIVPLLPAFTLFLMLTRVAIENAPANLFGGLRFGDSTNPVGFVMGLLGKKQPQTQVLAKDIPREEVLANEDEALAKSDGSVGKNVNPTRGKVNR